MNESKCGAPSLRMQVECKFTKCRVLCKLSLDL